MNKIEFTPNEDLQTLNRIFTDQGFQLRVVGGAVRDMIQGLEPKDIDLCTDATPVEMISLMTHDVWDAGGYIVETGLQHGTLTFVFNSIGYEITTLRIDTDTDGRHADVRFITKEEPCLNPKLLNQFIDMGYNLDQDYSFQELLEVFHNIDQ